MDDDKKNLVSVTRKHTCANYYNRSLGLQFPLKFQPHFN